MCRCNYHAPEPQLQGVRGRCYAPDGEREGQRRLRIPEACDVDRAGERAGASSRTRILEANGIISFAPRKIKLICGVEELICRGACRRHASPILARSGWFPALGRPASCHRATRPGWYAALTPEVSCVRLLPSALDNEDLPLAQICSAGRAGRRTLACRRSATRPGNPLQYRGSWSGYVVCGPAPAQRYPVGRCHLQARYRPVYRAATS